MYYGFDLLLFTLKNQLNRYLKNRAFPQINKLSQTTAVNDKPVRDNVETLELSALNLDSILCQLSWSG